MLTIGADGDRRLGALKFGIASRYLANLTSAIPLRNAATCRGAQDDDAKHFSSPGEGSLEGGHQRSRDPASDRVTSGDPPQVKPKLRSRLLAGGARIHVDFHADRHFNDLRGLPGHFGSPWSEQDELRPRDYKLVRIVNFASEIFASPTPLCFLLRRKRNSRDCAAKRQTNAESTGSY
jgi:hypothetical protein